MYRNQYDTDCITWSPQGRIFQVEYAMEAVKQGTCCVGLRSSTHVVLCSLKRNVSKLAGYHKKLFKIDEFVGVAMSGITADAKVISNFMRNECLQHKFAHFEPLTSARLVEKVGSKSQTATQHMGKRPFGVGLLVAAHDQTGPHLFETCPSGNYHEAIGVSFGARSQSSKTYLEKNFESFAHLNEKALIMHALKAIRASLAADMELSEENVGVGVVGQNTPWKELKPEEITEYLVLLNAE